MIVDVFIPSRLHHAGLESIVDAGFIQREPLRPFSDILINFADALSQHILTDAAARQLPELVAVGFWLRKANVLRMVREHLDKRSAGEQAVPRGVAFHIAPSNVDTIFLYSWMLSLIAGNKNIVRVPNELQKPIALLLEITRETLDAEEFKSIAATNIVLTYPRSDDISGWISEKADLRIIWGGDETVSRIRQLRAKPGSKDVTFADKFSCATIKADAFDRAQEGVKKEVARNFFNDAYWFDQKACSSPQIVYFVGTVAECDRARTSFWELLAEEIRSRGIASPASVTMMKLTSAYETISRMETALLLSRTDSTAPTVVRIAPGDELKVADFCGGGMFLERYVEKLNDLATVVSPKQQTLSWFGFEPKELDDLVSTLNGRGYVRIVPIGQALVFSHHWDGYDLLYEFTKTISMISNDTGGIQKINS
jgi:hypothetical protein